MYSYEKSSFFSVLRLNPYRFVISVFIIVLNFISGITTNMFFFAEGMSGYSSLCENAVSLSLPSALGALFWQLMLSFAVLYGSEGGWKMLCAFAALGLEGFVLGFSLSELLFHYGENGILLNLLLSTITGMGGVMLRVYCFLMPVVQESGKRKKNGERLFLWKNLFLLWLLQGFFVPLLALAD